MNLKLKQMKNVSELKFLTLICLMHFMLVSCTCITNKTKVNNDISMMIYYLLFLFLVERKKYVRIEQKIIKEKKTARARALQIKQKEIVIFPW